MRRAKGSPLLRSSGGVLVPPGAAPPRPAVRPLIGIPVERQIPAEAFQHFWEIARRGYPLVHTPYMRTDLARNQIARTMLEDTDATHLVMLDIDHLHPFDVADRLLRWALKEPGKFGVVGGLNFKRAEPYSPCIFALREGRYHFPVEWEEGITKVDAIGHGCIMIARWVLERIGSPWWKYEYGATGAESISEDMYFSERCRAEGIDVWCDTTLTSPHLSDVAVDAGAFRDWLASSERKVINAETGAIEDYKAEPSGR